MQYAIKHELTRSAWRVDFNKAAMLYPQIIICTLLTIVPTTLTRLLLLTAVNTNVTIHKRRWQLFRIFDTHLPHVGIFLLLSIVDFDHFLTPPQLLTSLMDSPYLGNPRSKN
jgi:hypothetical protein